MEEKSKARGYSLFAMPLDQLVATENYSFFYLFVLFFYFLYIFIVFLIEQAALLSF